MLTWPLPAHTVFSVRCPVCIIITTDTTRCEAVTCKTIHSAAGSFHRERRFNIRCTVQIFCKRTNPMICFFLKVGVIPKEGWERPRVPTRLLVRHRLRALGTVLSNAGCVAVTCKTIHSTAGSFHRERGFNIWCTIKIFCQRTYAWIQWIKYIYNTLHIMYEFCRLSSIFVQSPILNQVHWSFNSNFSS